MTEEIIQGSAEWYAIRLGKVTASRMADLTARTKSGWGAGRANYMAELLVERLTGEPVPTYTNAAMQWGTDKEPEARAAYEWRQGCEVKQIGFVAHPKIAMSGASPDGYVGDAGMLEVKCPNTATHIETLLGDLIPGKYISQVQWQMACSGRQWCDWVSFDPRMPAQMQLFVQRVSRDDTMIRSLEKDVTEFLAELDDKIARLRELYQMPEAA